MLKRVSLIGLLLLAGACDSRPQTADACGTSRTCRDGVDRTDRTVRYDGVDRTVYPGRDGVDRTNRIVRYDGVDRTQRLPYDGIDRTKPLPYDGVDRTDRTVRYDGVDRTKPLPYDGVDRTEYCP